MKEFSCSKETIDMLCQACLGEFLSAGSCFSRDDKLILILPIIHPLLIKNSFASSPINPTRYAKRTRRRRSGRIM